MNRFFENVKLGWKKDLKTATVFLLKLLILLWILKLFFLLYNQHLSVNPPFTSLLAYLAFFKWAVFGDGLVLLIINTIFFSMLFVCTSVTQRRWPLKMTCSLFLLINFACMLLNLADVFYFHFHLQRADADLLYVLDAPLKNVFSQHPWASLAALCGAGLLFYILLKAHQSLFAEQVRRYRFLPVAMILATFTLLLGISGRRFFIPTYPLAQINSTQLPFVQNSFHTFLYSMYRNREGIVRPYHLMPAEQFSSSMIRKIVRSDSGNIKKRNVVVFIMESVPQDFFDKESPYKVRMPFMDSLVKESVYFDQAFSYSHNSNKGIVAILGGIPTLTEIPLYHSNYAGLNFTPAGSILGKHGYQSAFFIGDGYDDFGFAKAVNWMGIQKYYSKEAIPGYENMQNHTMGLHDEHVLSFMFDKINEMKQPFFSVNFNVSTHFPNDLPSNYREPFPNENFSAEMKSMNYYSECLRRFFLKAATQPWYGNTVFIFCADHWIYPDGRNFSADIVQSFRIPVMIFDPEKKQGKTIHTPVSQLDVLNTIVAAAGINDTVISYGENLLAGPASPNRVVCMKENTALYQAIDSSYVLGFNVVTRKPEFCYNYRTDPKRSNNLVGKMPAETDSLLLKLKIFLQAASMHYNKKPGFE